MGFNEVIHELPRLTFGQRRILISVNLKRNVSPSISTRIGPVERRLATISTQN